MHGVSSIQFLYVVEQGNVLFNELPTVFLPVSQVIIWSSCSEVVGSHKVVGKMHNKQLHWIHKCLKWFKK